MSKYRAAREASVIRLSIVGLDGVGKSTIRDAILLSKEEDSSNNVTDITNSSPEAQSDSPRDTAEAKEEEDKPNHKLSASCPFNIIDIEEHNQLLHFYAGEVTFLVCSADSSESLHDFEWPQLSVLHSGILTKSVAALLVNKWDLPPEQRAFFSAEAIEWARRLAVPVYFTSATTTTIPEESNEKFTPLLEIVEDAINLYHERKQNWNSLHSEKTSRVWESLAMHELGIVIDCKLTYGQHLSDNIHFQKLIAPTEPLDTTAAPAGSFRKISVDNTEYALTFVPKPMIQKASYAKDDPIEAMIFFVDISNDGVVRNLISSAIDAQLRVGRNMFYITYDSSQKEEDAAAADLAAREALRERFQSAVRFSRAEVFPESELNSELLPKLIRKITKRSWQFADDMVNLFVQTLTTPSPSKQDKSRLSKEERRKAKREKEENKEKRGKTDPITAMQIKRDSYRDLTWAYNREDLSDIYFEFPNNEQQQENLPENAQSVRRLYAHRAILYARSSFFRDLFTKDPTISSMKISDVSLEHFEMILRIIYSGSFGYKGGELIKRIPDDVYLSEINRAPPAVRARKLGDCAERDITLYGAECFDALAKYPVDAMMNNITKFKESESTFIGVCQTLKDIVIFAENLKADLEPYFLPESSAQSAAQGLEYLRARAGELLAQFALLTMLFQQQCPNVIFEHAVVMCNVFFYRIEELSLHVFDAFFRMKERLNAMPIKPRKQKKNADSSDSEDEEESEEENGGKTKPTVSLEIATAVTPFFLSLVKDTLMGAMDQVMGRMDQVANPTEHGAPVDRRARNFVGAVKQINIGTLWTAIRQAYVDGKIVPEKLARALPGIIGQFEEVVDKFAGKFSSTHKEDKDLEELHEKRAIEVEKAAKEFLIIGHPKVLNAMKEALTIFGDAAIESTLAQVHDEFLRAAFRGYIEFIRQVPVASDEEHADLQLQATSSAFYNRFDDQMILLSPQEVSNGYSDVLFTFPESSSTSDKLHAHKVLLACHSEHFRRMFLSQFRERTAREIPITNLTPSIFAIVLRFIYSNGNISVDQELRNINNNSNNSSNTEDLLENAISLFEASHLYEMQPLHAQCERFIMNFIPDIEISDIIPIYHIAESCQAPQLATLCKHYILRFADRVADRPELIPAEIKACKRTFSKKYHKLSFFVIQDPDLHEQISLDFVEKLFSASYNDQISFKTFQKGSSNQVVTKYLDLPNGETLEARITIFPRNVDPETFRLSLEQQVVPGEPQISAAVVLLYDTKSPDWVVMMKRTIDELWLATAEPDILDEYIVTKRLVSINPNVLVVADASDDIGGTAAQQLRKFQVGLNVSTAVYTPHVLVQSLDAALIRCLAFHLSVTHSHVTRACPVTQSDFGKARMKLEEARQKKKKRKQEDREDREQMQRFLAAQAQSQQIICSSLFSPI